MPIVCDIVRGVCRRGDSGQGNVEYVALVLLVGVLLGGVVSMSLDLGGVVTAGARMAICRVIPVQCPSSVGKADGQGSADNGTHGSSGSSGSSQGTGDQHHEGGVSGFFHGLVDGAGDAAGHVGGWLKTGGTTAWHGVKGIGFGIKDDAVGIYDLVRHPVDNFNAIKDLVVRTSTQEGAKFASRWQSGDHWGALRGLVADTYTTEFQLLSQLVVDDGVKGDWRNGDKAQAVGRVIWNVGSFFIPGVGWALRIGKGLKIASVAAKAAKVAKIAAKAGKLEKALSAAEKAEKAARKAEEIARKNPTAKNVEAARKARQAANEAHASAKSAQVNKAIDDNLKSPDPDTRLEGEAGAAVRGHVVDVNRKVWEGSVQRGEVDVETKKSIIEATTMKKGKMGQVRKYQTKLFNPQGKAVILYAPKYNGPATRAAEQAGAYVVRSPAELQTLLKKLGEG